MKKQNTIKYATWNVSGTAHKWEELDSVLNLKQIKIAAITESQKKLKGTMETNNYTVIYNGVNRSIWAQAGIMIWSHISIKNTITNYTHWSKRTIKVKLNIGRREIIIFWTLCPRRRKSWRKRTRFITSYRKQYTKLTKTVTSYSQETWMLE
jgi:hypothetical protein